MTRDEATAILAAAGVPDPARDARRLFAALGVGSAFDEAVARRAARVPVSHILGYRDFWKHRFRVSPDVLDPRPETETLIEVALGGPFATLLDLGTGSGAILLSILAERPDVTGLGTDISAEALAVADHNARALGVEARSRLRLSDWWERIGGSFDLIVSNPPYIAAAEIAGLSPEVRDHEPRPALTDGGDGLDAYRRISAGVRDHLAPGGRILVEIGPTQARAVSAIFAAAGLEPVAVHPDLDGRDRVVEARLSAQELARNR